MTRSRLPQEIVFRPVEEGDRPSLETFSCSRGALHEDEVEQFVRQSALARALAPETRYRLLVFSEGRRLVAVAAYHPEVLLVASGERAFRGTRAVRLQVLALSVEDQGRRLEDDRRLSDVVMETLISEAMSEETSVVLTAVVARDNLRSLALCERYGLTSQIAHDARHLRVSGHFNRRL